MGRTTIQVSEELADELHERKDRGDSYEKVIWRLIERADAFDRMDGHTLAAVEAAVGMVGDEDFREELQLVRDLIHDTN